MHKTEEHIRAALQAGASGYLLKDAARAELLTAIVSVMRGQAPSSARRSPDRIVAGYLERDAAEGSDARALRYADRAARSRCSS